MPLQIRRGTNAERENMTIPLAPGEPLYTTDQGFLYIGNGTTPGGVQVTGYGDENAVDAVGAALVAGEHQNIQFIYGQTQDVANRIDVEVDLSNYNDIISATGFVGDLTGNVTGDINGSVFSDDSTILVDAVDGVLRGPLIGSVTGNVTGNLIGNVTGNVTGDLIGSVFGDDSSLLVDATNSSINLNGNVKGDIIPDQNEAYDIGSSSNKFRDLYLSGSSLYLGSAQITSTNSVINLPAGSTVNGVEIGTGSFGDSSAPFVELVTDLNVGNFSIISDAGDVTISPNGNLVVNSDLGLTGNIVKSSGNLQVICNNGALQIGSATAGAQGNLLIVRNNYSTSLSQGFTFAQHHNTRDAVNFSFFRTRGTSLNPEPLQDDDDIADIAFLGWAGTNIAPAAAISVVVDGTPSIDQLPTKFEFATANGINFDIRAELSAVGIWKVNNIQGLSSTLSIIGNLTGDIIGSVFADDSTVLVDSTEGNLSGNTVAANVAFQLPIYTDDAARSTAIPSPTQGMMIFMQSGTTPVASQKIQFYNGSSWENL